jgi:hypothetical protein
MKARISSGGALGESRSPTWPGCADRWRPIAWLSRIKLECKDMKKLTIDFVSDVMCPWCTLGLRALEQAVDHLSDELSVDIHFRPFELNPDAPKEGLLVFENQQRKYGLSKQQVLANYANITERGKALGFTFNMEKRITTTPLMPTACSIGRPGPASSWRSSTR